MPTDDKVDNQSNKSATSSDSGVIIDDRLMSNSNQCNIDIVTSIDRDTSITNSNDHTAINLNNILNLAKNISPTNKDASKSSTPPHKSSPTLSIRSTSISITSIQSDAVSSVIESDIDEFEDTNGNYTIKKLGQQTSTGSGSAGIPKIGGSDGVVLLQQRVDESPMGPLATTSLGSGSPQIASMAFSNSTDITIGQKNYYQGPVTIQQFLIENRRPEAVTTGGMDNLGFASDSSTEAAKKPTDRGDSKENAAPSQPYKFIFNRRAAIITAVIISLTIVLAVAFVMTSSVLKRKSKISWDDEETRKNIPANSTIGQDNVGGGTVLRLIPRDEWLAEPPTEELDRLKLPLHRVIIAHTATESCSSQAQCSYRTQIIQQFHMKSREFSDIAYNFLVGGDGAVYEGRGWDYQGAHTKGFNLDSVGVAFIGTFLNEAPPEKQLNAAKLIMEEGVRLNKLVPDYRLYGARQLISSESPGIALYSIIKKWPHWVPK